MTTQQPQLRTVARIITAISTSDGAGVRLRRNLGKREGTPFEPFFDAR